MIEGYIIRFGKFLLTLFLVILTCIVYPTYGAPCLIIHPDFIYPDLNEWHSFDNCSLDSNFPSVGRKITQDTALILSQLTTEYVIASNSGADPPEVIEIIEKILELDPASASFWFYLGFQRKLLNEYQMAVDAITKSLELYDQSANRPFVQLYEYLGYCYHMLGYFRQEMKVYIRGSIHYPDHPTLLGRKAVCFYSLGNSKEAEKLIAEYQLYWEQKGSTEADILQGLGMLFLDSKNMKAEKYFREALALDPEDINKQISLARVLISRGIRIGEAMSILEELNRKDPGNPLILHLYGWGYFMIENYTLAWDHLSAADSLYTEYNHHLSKHLDKSEKFLARNTR